MPLDPEFLADCPYLPEGVFLDEIVAVDRDAGRVHARMNSCAELPLTVAQRADPVRHPRHVAGGLLLHVSGILGFAHAYYVLDLRHADGWTGYGALVHKLRFPNLARIGDPLELSAEATRIRVGPSRAVVRYRFEFEQAGTLVYEGDQTAVFVKVEEPGDGAEPTPR